MREKRAVRRCISIHALRKESDHSQTGTPHLNTVFQSTLSVRRATASGIDSRSTIPISIHALRKESDLAPPPVRDAHVHFNPRSP